jgi:putative transcriptional regulator
MKNTIRVERAILRISQQELADKIGVTRQTINAIELEKYIPSAVAIMKIAVVCSKKVEEIFSLEEKDWK